MFMSSNLAFKYRIDKVETVNFNIDTDIYQSGAPIKMQISFKESCAEGSNLLRIECLFQIANNAFEQSFLKVAVAITFEIHQEDVSKIITTVDDKPTIIPEVLRKFNQMTYDTLRGVLHVKTDGTSFNKFMAPGWDIPIQ